jgi:hypothetical protein
MTGSDKAFWAGAGLITLAMLIYGVHTQTGHALGLYDLVWHAIPFSLGGLLVAPKLFPSLFVQAMVTVRTLFGKRPDQLT